MHVKRSDLKKTRTLLCHENESTKGGVLRIVVGSARLPEKVSHDVGHRNVTVSKHCVTGANKDPTLAKKIKT